jgi:hypothetical protein
METVKDERAAAERVIKLDDGGSNSGLPTGAGARDFRLKACVGGVEL